MGKVYSWHTLLIWYYLTVLFLDQLKEADNGVIGPVPLVQDAANQDIREWGQFKFKINAI